MCIRDRDTTINFNFKLLDIVASGFTRLIYSPFLQHCDPGVGRSEPFELGQQWLQALRWRPGQRCYWWGLSFLFSGRPQGRYYRPSVDNRPFCLNGRYSWICGRYCIKMVDISSKFLRMLIDFPYYSKYDKSQDSKLYYSAIKWSNMKITTSTLFYMHLLGSRI